MGSLLLAILVVLGMLIVGLSMLQHRDQPLATGLQSFQVEYLTPEEAAALLGEEQHRFRQPVPLDLPPLPAGMTQHQVTTAPSTEPD